jgi:hypothetical protein
VGAGATIDDAATPEVARRNKKGFCFLASFAQFFASFAISSCLWT